ncbi:Uncharacterised protein [uncultured archaeon]|nr:Uncharacterised protein [uncultured archaeon]
MIFDSNHIPIKYGDWIRCFKSRRELVFQFSKTSIPLLIFSTKIEKLSNEEALLEIFKK